MKSRTALCVAFILASLSPAAAGNAADNTPAVQTATAWRMAQATTATAPAASTAGAASTTTSTASTGKTRRPKKPTADHRPPARSGAAIVKEGGKTCSGLDEYRVCW